MEKSRYDEEADEWIVPFIKKKNLGDGSEGTIGNGSALAPLTGVGGVAGGAFGGNGSKMFPDINGGKAGGPGSNGGFSAQAGSTLRDPAKLNGKSGWGGAGGEGSEEGDARRSPVPLLTLPGNLLTPAALAQQQQYAGSSSSSGHGGKGAGGSGTGESRGGFYLPQISSRSDANSARQGGSSEQGGALNFSQVQILPQQPTEKKKKSKSKAPKGEGRRAGSAGGGIGYGGEGEYGDQTDQETSCSSSQHAQYSQYAQHGAMEAKAGEEGAGESAGPLEDWGFAFQGDAALPTLNGKAGTYPP